MATTDTATWVGSRIKKAREGLGLNQTELGRRFGRTQTAISYWENGRRTPGLDDLLGIARVLGQTVDYFLPPVEPQQPIRAVLAATAERLQLGGLGADLAVIAEAAERCPAHQVEIEILANDPVEAGQELLRKADVASPPVDVEGLARRCAVTIVQAAFSHPLRGAVITIGTGAVIAINEPRLPRSRRGSSAPLAKAERLVGQRFFIAHQLGHYLLRHHDRVFIHLSSAAEDGNPPAHDAHHESDANQFAAELLLPAGLVAAAARTEPSVERLAARFQVSPLAMAYRLIDLGLR